MAKIETIDVTTALGSETFPVNDNDVYNLVETIASQNIMAVQSSNRIEDGFYEYDVSNGKVIEEAIIKMAQSQEFVKTGAPSLAPKDAELLVKYFNNWETKQYQTTSRRADIRAIISKGDTTSLDGVIAEILSTLKTGEGYDDYKAMRDLIKNASVGVDVKASLFGGKVAKNMKGVLFEIRKAYNALKATNNIGLPSGGFEQATPVDDIRIAISEDVLNLIDVTELANVFNLSKEELFGKLVIIPHDSEYIESKILVYDRKALGRGTRLYEFSQDVIGKGLYTNHYLTAERCYFYNSLFKCISLDVTKAIATAEADLLVANS